VSTRRSHFVLIGAILAALVGSLLLAIPGSPIHRKPTLGLDLQGGLEVVLKAVPPKGHQLTQEDLNRSRTIIEERINGLGVTEPDVRTQPPDQIVVQLAGVHDPAKAAALIGKTAQLQFFDWEPSLTGPSRGLNGQPQPTPKLYDLLQKVHGQAQKGTPEGYYLFKTITSTTKVPPKKAGGKPTTRTTTKHALVEGPIPQLETVKKRFPGGKVPENYEILAVPANTEAIREKGVPAWYLVKLPPALTGEDLKLSGTRADFDTNKRQWVVLLNFTGKGSKKFEEITKAEYERGRQRALLNPNGNDPNVVPTLAGQSAIVLDGVIQSKPYIDYTDKTLQDGISGGAEITTGERQSAKDLELVVQTGALPVNFEQIERTDVSATLGKDSLREAWHAAAVGLLLVAIFLLVVYRFLGLVAVFGLAIYGALYYAAILLFGVTLTLPGFAGLILTIGVAADANVVIFERIKEEVRAGKSVRAAISAGYAKGFHTIVDANVVTAITALVLFAVATANVRGFALMLLIGTVISLVTAVAATRAMLGMLAGFRWFDNARLMGAQGQQRGRWLQIDFMGRRNLWFAISGTIVVVSVVALGVKGLNLGIDFKGGTQVSFATTQPVSLSDIRKQAADVGHADAVVQGRGAAVSGDEYRAFQMRMRSLTEGQQNQLTRDLQQEAHATKIGVKNVSASFGRQIARDAILAIIVSLILIVIYIAIRFEFKFALPVIVAMLHDIVITVGVYALVGREVSTATVAAVLTVLGYSIYDTIIIFDRIRENIPLMRRSTFATIANVSLWETIRRSLATTFITLLPIVSLLILGGDTLKDFAFALLVGILSGAYSSIFIAAPLLTMWKEREPDYARRKGTEEAPESDGAGAAGRRRRLPFGGPVLDTDTLALQESEQALAAEPTPALLDVTPPVAGAQARREKRRQRRRTKPHGRAR
jgi:SecD/SecF fusion protein